MPARKTLAIDLGAVYLYPMGKWLFIGLIGIGLALVGYKLYVAQQSQARMVSHSPIAVAAVRGGAQEGFNSHASVGEVTVDYARSLQNDKVIAQEAADKYEAAAKVRDEAAQNAATAAEAQ